MTRPFERRVLLGPSWLRRAAMLGAKNAEERWMLIQGGDVRRSFVKQVLDRGEDAADREAWMLRQPDAVRESYIREVLDR